MSAQPVTPVIDPAIHALRPDFRAVSLTVTLAGPAVTDADAIVAETLARAYGVAGRIETCSQGTPFVVTEGALPPAASPPQ